jgi:hypothetical protein
MRRILFFLAVLPVAADAAPLFVIPSGFQVTQYASGLNYPSSMTPMSDGSLIVGTTTPSGGGGFTDFYLGVSQLIRLTDSTNSGVADGSSVIATGLPGAVTSVRQAGNLLVVATTGQGGLIDNLNQADITFLAPGGTPASPYTVVGSLHIAYPILGNAISVALETRATPGVANSYDVFFSLGAGFNDGTPGGDVSLSGLTTGSAHAGSIYKLTVDTTGGSVAATGLSQIADGLRNSGGLVYNSLTGDLYFGDNGYEDNVGTPVSSDELNRITAAQLAAGTTIHFGYPSSYTDYATGNFVGGAGVPAFYAYRQALGGAQSFGLNEIALAPSLFPLGLNAGIFGGFFGNFNNAGPVNGINPVIFCDFAAACSYFVNGGLVGVGHPSGLASTESALFIADFNSQSGWGGGTGVIYRITADAVPEPMSLGLVMLGSVIMAAARVGQALGQRRALRPPGSLSC